jgi:hypothetical protein
MTLAHLDNLVKTNNLKTEPADQKEFDGMVISAKRRLQDANVESLSDDSRFSLAYGAAHALSWRRCVGMDTAQTIDIWCFNVWNTL